MSSWTVPVGGEALAGFFLDGLRKDAFLMEWGAYREPALPRDNEFPSVFASFWERVHTLLKWHTEPCLVCIAQVQYPDSSYESLVCVQSSALGTERVFHQWKPKRALPIDTIQHPLEAANQILRAETITTDIHSLAADPADIAVARYFVRPVLDERDRKRRRNLTGLLALEPVARQKGFVHTESFMSSEQRDLGTFSDAYYASVLGLALPHGCVFSDEYLRWLEVLHVSFQLSWGFPLLAQKREELARQQEQASHLEEIRTVAKSLSETIERHVIGQAHRLLSLLDPGTMLDNNRLFPMFDSSEMNKSRVFWSGKTPKDRVVALHNPIKNDDESNRRFVAFAVHLILGTPDLHTFTTSEELIAAARNSLQTARFEMGLMRLLLEALERPFRGFNIIKEIWFAPRDTGREVSLLALAIRFVLTGGIHNQNFRAIVVDEAGHQIILTRSHLAHEQLFDDAPDKARPWHESPHLRGVLGVRAIEWLQPFCALIANGLQHLSPGDAVFINDVRLIATEEGCEIRCDLNELIPGQIGLIKKLYDDVAHMTAGECSPHNLRGPMRELRDRISRPDLVSRMDFSIDDSTKTLRLAIR